MTSKLASLHSGLVARKGEAMPAVSHPLFSYVDTPRPLPRDDQAVARRVWPPVPQHGADNVQSAPLPVQAEPDQPVDRDQSSDVAKSVRLETTSTPAPYVPAHSKPGVEDTDSSPRHRFTFRLTHDQHHRLRLAAAIRDESLQHVLSEALDNHLAGLCACSLKDCACMAAADTARA